MTAKTQSDIAIDVEALSRKYQEERDLRLRPEANDQFREVTGSFAHFARDRHADPGFTRDAIVEDRDVVIIGGGFGGLLAGGRLREQGVASLRIVERGADFGGTWYWNRYPGAACDVESYIYMPMLEETGYLPSRKYARAPEIQAHCRRLAEHFDLYREALLQTEVDELNWNGARQRWIVTTSRGDRIAARFVLSCAGPQSKPRLPGVPGIESFAGRTFHSSRWDYDYTGGEEDGRLTGLVDKRVAVIGTGATAVQIIPQVAAWAKQLYVFQRTPSSVDERNDRLTEPEFAASLQPGWQRKRMANFTILTAGGYQDEDLVGDGWTEITRAIMPRPSPDGSPVEVDPEALRLSEMRKMEQARRRIDNLVDNKATAEALKPWYHYFCKRPCFHDEYLQAFNRPNVTLVDTRGKGVERITPSGVVVDGVNYDVDCLIYATGFEVLTGYSRETGVEVHGRDGRALSDHWGKGLRTLHGIHTHGFPNFMLLGRLQSGFSGNYVHIADEQARHMAHIVGQCLRDGIATVETSASAEAAWVDIILASGQRRAFLESCTPSYFNYEGQRPAGAENDDVYPGGAEAYIRLLEEWRAEGSMAGLDRR